MNYEDQIKLLIENLLLNKSLVDIDELPAEYELTGNEVMYIVADGIDYKVKNSRIVAAFAQALSEHQSLVGSENELGHFKLGANFTVDQDDKIQLDISSELTTINNALGDKADLDESGKVPIEQIPDMGEVIASNLSGAEIQQLIKKAASNNVRNSHDAETSTTQKVNTKLKTITLTKGLIGSIRVTAQIKTNLSIPASATTTYKIYCNGVFLQELGTTNSSAYISASTDIVKNWNANDTIELWVSTEGVGTVTAYTKEFRLSYDDSPTVAVPSTNS